MVLLELTTDEANLLKMALESAPFNGTIGQAGQVFEVVQKLHDIMARLMPMQTEEAKEDGTGN